MQDMTSRRRAIGRLASAGAAAGFGAPALAGTAHPDAELLRLWAEWLAMWRANLELPAELEEAERDLFLERWGAIGDRIEQTAPQTMVGVAVRLRYLAVAGEEDGRQQDLLAAGQLEHPDLTQDYRDALLRRTIRDVERLAGFSVQA